MPNRVPAAVAPPRAEALADAVAAIDKLDSSLEGVRSEWCAHRRCVARSGITCETMRLARSELDKLLDRRLSLMAARDMELLWIDSGGNKELSV